LINHLHREEREREQPLFTARLSISGAELLTAVVDKTDALITHRSFSGWDWGPHLE
jgi:hypothetical protein